MSKEREITLLVSVLDGKFIFISYADDYRVHCLRYGEPWMIFKKGHKAVLALMFAAEEPEDEPRENSTA